MKNKNGHKTFNFTLFFLLIVIIVLIGIITNPKLSLSSAASGIAVWFNIILPSLLPFFIISEILIGLGFVDFIGKLLQPLMRPIFNVPGEGAFPLTMSILSGYPVGAKLTSRLREEGLITKDEGTRLICFTSTSGPLFMLGAVSIGMLNDSKLAPLIIIPHYLSVLVLGLLFSFYKSNNRRLIISKKRNLFEEIQESYVTWIKTKKSIGSLITKAVKESMDTIILIGGLVIFYSVIVEILFNMEFLNNIIYHLSNLLPIDIQLIKGIIIGFFEVTIGCKNIAASQSSLITKILILNFTIGWSGFSVHSQALSFINNTDINTKLYIVSKFLHGILSVLFGYALYLLKYQNYIQPTIYYPMYYNNQFNLSNWIYLLTSSTKLALIMIIYIFLLSMLVSTAFKTLKGSN
ncbi:sporulation integral membrane protein YlbJ [Tissierella carlieri]|uniref:Sporulation integral membrane protein YlbJ n=1 Tax=Tissierella carlieri TaxID=689904 RepID=A0ABT1S5T5_9FIRM|nr:sporulation integral membrane protein YlbJ [Tissierella carlieri]MBU5314192.1 sporulation integral membrane protein YlbJ [Tissierella carlieri]MCQ4921828.1 sporulation integral membrane protein YlbJ [Tissierella carlieri]